ncbi:hypothetical protein H7J07_05475 [Mycobacterium koreense]|uniref:hypothetical protein n=1 Tax=Mycolicibacillus koreensis TaxID=1069220 RepID=UPI00138C44BB|nr:hypothetical protein [Mycolicibacillus koreensis]MCV7247674.1 hypothetical protein [Mycolicibacillus koreensis]BBY54059.1 hypothetical protein MKOR_13100 [Mycolicibacillus koreensis]
MAVWTVVGAYSGGELMLFGAIEGKHQVGGDLGYHGYQPFADHVDAGSAQEALEKAAQ